MSTSTSILDLQNALATARTRLKHAVGADEHRAAHDAVLAAERDLAAARNEPHAVPMGFPFPWSTGAPLPHLLQNDDRTFLVFVMSDLGRNSDGSYATVRRPDEANSVNLAVVEFKRCLCTKMGTPNDETLHGHPLHGRGLANHSAMRVPNSAWIKELQAINSVHSRHGPETWGNLSHFIFGFHDCTFECVAESFWVAPRTAALPDVLAEICNELCK